MIATPPAALVALDVEHVELPARSRNMIARSRASQRLDLQRGLHLRRCRLDILFLPGLRSLQQQLGCKIPMRSRLAPRPQQTDKTRGVFQRRQVSTKPTARLNRWRESELEIWCMCHARIVAQPRRRPGARTYLSSRFWLCLLTLTAKDENRALEFKRASSLDLSGVLCAPSTGVCLEACRDRATDGVGPAHLAVARLVLPQSSALARN
jgi:hypothetical protein